MTFSLTTFKEWASEVTLIDVNSITNIYFVAVSNDGLYLWKNRSSRESVELYPFIDKNEYDQLKIIGFDEI